MATKSDREQTDEQLREKTVDELRKLAKEREIPRTSGMKKDELVAALSGTGRVEGGSGGGGQAKRSGGRKGGGEEQAKAKGGESKSLKYSQRVDSVDEHEERPGRSLYTQDHDVIKQWAEARDAVPATIEGTGPGDQLGVLRFDFPGGDDESNSRLQHVTWEEFFETFDARGLNFIYQEHRSGGEDSNFFRFENPNREDA